MTGELVSLYVYQETRMELYIWVGPQQDGSRPVRGSAFSWDSGHSTGGFVPSRPVPPSCSFLVNQQFSAAATTSHSILLCQQKECIRFVNIYKRSSRRGTIQWYHGSRTCLDVQSCGTGIGRFRGTAVLWQPKHYQQQQSTFARHSRTIDTAVHLQHARGTAATSHPAA